VFVSGSETLDLSRLSDCGEPHAVVPMTEGSVVRAWVGVLLPVAAVVTVVIVGLAHADGSAPAAIAVFAGTLLLLALAYGAVRSEAIVLGAVSATPLSPTEAPDLADTVAVTARRLRIPPPRLTISRTATPFALVVGHGRDRTTLCVSSGLLADLDPDGLLAVVTHQLTFAAGPLLLPRTVASAWATAVLASTDGVPLLSVANPLGLAVRHLAVTAAQQIEADERAARSMADPDALSRVLARLDARVGRAPLHPTGPLVAVAGLMITSPFGNDVRAAQLAGQPDLRSRLLRLGEPAARRLGPGQR
jgi:heat shock protein HtpX